MDTGTTTTVWWLETICRAARQYTIHLHLYTIDCHWSLHFKTPPIVCSAIWLQHCLWFKFTILLSPLRQYIRHQMTPVISKFGNLLLNRNSPIYAPAAGHVNRPKSALVFDQNCLRRNGPTFTTTLQRTRNLLICCFFALDLDFKASQYLKSYLCTRLKAS